MLYSTYLGTGQIFLSDLALDAAGNLYLSGEVFGGDPLRYPTTPNAYQPSYPAADPSLGSAVILSKFSFGERFCSYAPQLQVDASTTREQGFATVAQFALPAGGSVDLMNVPVTATVSSLKLGDYAVRPRPRVLLRADVYRPFRESRLERP